MVLFSVHCWPFGYHPKIPGTDEFILGDGRRRFDDPLLADSDGDGSTDGSESLAGTNPHDTNSLLEIVRLELSGEMGVVEWKSRGGKEYEVLRALSVEGLVSSPTVLGPFMATGGTGLWSETTSASTNAMPGANAFYGVKVMQ